MTYKEIVYMCIDLLKISSDDSYYTKEHIIFLVNKFRALILKQRYSDIKKQIPISNYQELCLNLTEVPAIAGEPCEGAPYLRSTIKVPTTMEIGNPRVYPIDFYQGEITYISKDRMRYVGYNKYLSNIIYCSKAPDGYLYFKSCNPQFLHLEKVKFNAIFEDAKEASELSCDNNIICDLMDKEFPLESSLVPVVIDFVFKEIKGTEYSPQDKDNNAEDDLSNVAVK